MRSLGIAGLLVAAQLGFGAPNSNPWQVAKVISISYNQKAPAGDYAGQKKGVQYVLSLPDGNQVTAYDLAATVFSGFPKDRASEGDSVKVRLKGSRLWLLSAKGKQRKLYIGKTSKRP